MAAAMRNRRIIDFLWCHQFGEVSRWAGPGTDSAVNEHIQINTQDPQNTNNHQAHLNPASEDMHKIHKNIFLETMLHPLV